MLLLRMRPATPDDLALAYEITEDAMRGYAEETWGNWDEEDNFRNIAPTSRPRPTGCSWSKTK